MTSLPTIIPCRTVGEWALQSARAYQNPFTDVRVDGTFIAPSGQIFTIPRFYDGENTWRVRFNPGEIVRYLIARYDAFRSAYFWTLMNEYEYYPDGNWHHNPVADRWAMRVGCWVKQVAQHGHVVSVHNGPNDPPFARRFVADPEAVDAIMFQTWGTTAERDAWLAAGIEDRIKASPGASVQVLHPGRAVRAARCRLRTGPARWLRTRLQAAGPGYGGP